MKFCFPETVSSKRLRIRFCESQASPHSASVSQGNGISQFVYLLLLLLLPYQLNASFELSGYAKTLNFAAPARENEGAKGLSGNRVRLEGRWNDKHERFNARLISDLEALGGSLLASQRQVVSGLIASDELFYLNSDFN